MFHDLVSHRQSETRATLLGCEERVKDFVPAFWRDSAPMISHANQNSSFLVSSRDYYLTPGRGCLDSVDDQIEKHLLEQLGVALHLRQLRRHVLPQGDRIPADSMSRKPDDRIEQRVYFNGLVFRRPGTRKIEEFGEQPVQPLRLLLNDFEALLVLRLEVRVPLQDAGCAGDAPQRISEFVRQPGRQLTNREQTLGPFHLLEVLLQLKVHLRQAAGGLLKIFAMFPVAIGENAGEKAHQAQDRKLNHLFDGVIRELARCPQHVR
ncbi:MAG: hypothetical protein ABSB88_10995 [Bryobacteraceae bacterium]